MATKTLANEKWNTAKKEPGGRIQNPPNSRRLAKPKK